MNITLKPFFYFENLKSWEWIVVSIYSFLTIWLYTLYLHHPENRSDVLLMYPVISQLFIIFFLYASLRNLSSFLIWFCFGIFHLYIYTITQNDTYPNIVGGHASSSFRNTFFLLLFYQILRYVSRKVQLREYVNPSKGGDKALLEGVKVSLTDKLIFASFMIFWFALTYTAM